MAAASGSCHAHNYEGLIDGCFGAWLRLGPVFACRDASFRPASQRTPSASDAAPKTSGTATNLQGVSYTAGPHLPKKNALACMVPLDEPHRRSVGGLSQRQIPAVRRFPLLPAICDCRISDSGCCEALQITRGTTGTATQHAVQRVHVRVQVLLSWESSEGGLAAWQFSLLTYCRSSAGPIARPEQVCCLLQLQLSGCLLQQPGSGNTANLRLCTSSKFLKNYLRGTGTQNHRPALPSVADQHMRMLQSQRASMLPTSSHHNKLI